MFGAVFEEELAAGDAGLVLLGLELGDVLLPPDHGVARLRQLRLVGGVDAVAVEEQRGAERLAHVGQERHAADQVGAVAEDRPGVGGRLVAGELVVAVGDAGVGDHVGDAELHRRVERRGDVVRVDVAERGDAGVVDLVELAVAGELGDHVAGGEEDVVAGGAGVDLGEHGLVGVEHVDHDAAAVLLLEPFDQLGVDVVGPREEVELGLGGAAARDEQGGGGGEDENAFAHCRVPFMTGFRRRRAVCGRLERAGRRGDRRRPARANGAGLYGIPPRNATEIFARGGARGRHLVEWGA